MDVMVASASVYVDFSNVPNGTYRGVWGGYSVECEIGGKEYLFVTKVGALGIDIPVEVVVKNGRIMVKTI